MNFRTFIKARKKRRSWGFKVRRRTATYRELEIYTGSKMIHVYRVWRKTGSMIYQYSYRKDLDLELQVSKRIEEVAGG